ncbi:hypothetical protein N7508_004229 [Penicillium antarcticum]|uniref:uncharacterized protein n=1 Tax=Penicillium antarcticum TaxID=416450 RepID=UPI0023A38BD9|nr:uncharacterized protein N7508_004229 [Penicillium antarcticum]KAJ5308850.1 hypothetical protein N7508_004229 [Penicillium antarcticum]
MAIAKVIVVGAGPSGLILSLLLAKKGITVELLDAGAELDKQPRAAHYASAATYELERAGVLDDLKERGFSPKGFAFRKFDTSFIAGINHASLPEDYPYKMQILPLDQLGQLLYEHIQRQPKATVKWTHRVLKIGQDQGKAWVDIETPSGTHRSTADYVVGCDGASSTIRRELFGPEYPGETLNAQIIATNVYYNFDRYNYWDSNFIVHPTKYYMAARITKDGLYRVTYGDVPGLSREEYIARQPARYEEILPGSPKPGDYRITNISPYKLQQRCAPSFRDGRVLLAADAAHLCNPFGGLGLTGGIADVGNLFDALVGIHDGLADDSILDKYSEVRMRIWREIIDPMSRENFRRLWDQDPEKALENDRFFQICKKSETNEALSRELALGLDVLRFDMTQFYNKTSETDDSRGKL